MARAVSARWLIIVAACTFVGFYLLNKNDAIESSYEPEVKILNLKESKPEPELVVPVRRADLAQTTESWQDRWSRKLEQCAVSLAEDDFIGDTALVESPTTQQVTLESSDKPQFSNVSMISLLIDTYGLRGFDFEGSTLEEDDLRRQHMYLPYCYETRQADIEDKCPRISLLPDSQVGDAQATTPPYLYFGESKLVKGKRSKGIFTRIHLRTGLLFGPYVGVTKRELKGHYAWKSYFHPSGTKVYIDGGDEKKSNWLRYVNSARWVEEQHMFAIEHFGNVYYLLIKDVKPGDELLTWYGPGYLETLGYKTKKGYKTQVYGIAPERHYIKCKHGANCDQL